MQKVITSLAVIANFVVSFWGGRQSIGTSVPYAYEEVVDLAENTCETGFFVGGCKDCSPCDAWEYPAGGCTYFKDTFCTLCEPVKNCPQENIRCTQRDDERCLECDPGFYGDDCKPCLVCESGFYESTKCSQDANTECTRCSECGIDEFTLTACSYFTDTVCQACSHCSPMSPTPSLKGYTSRKCDVDTYVDPDKNIRGNRAFDFPESVYTNGLDTQCSACALPAHDGVDGPLVDQMVVQECREFSDTIIMNCNMCPCAHRATCQYQTEYCDAGDELTVGEDVQCADCTKIKGGEVLNADGSTKTPFQPGTEWEVFRCGGTSDALFKECSVCQEGEYEATACSQTSDTVCPACNKNVAQTLMGQCMPDAVSCTTWDDTSCSECNEKFFGTSCCYHQYHGSCGTMSTRERIPRRLGYEIETNEEFIATCQELCDEFSDCLAFEVEDGGTDLQEAGPNSFTGKTATCYFKSSFTQEQVSTGGNGVAGAKKHNVWRGEDPTFDCFSHVCRQEAGFAGAYDFELEVGDGVIPEVELTDDQKAGFFRRASEGYAGGSSPASRTEFRRAMEKAGDTEGIRMLNEREAYIAKFRDHL